MTASQMIKGQIYRVVEGSVDAFFRYTGDVSIGGEIDPTRFRGDTLSNMNGGLYAYHDASVSLSSPDLWIGGDRIIEAPHPHDLMWFEQCSREKKVVGNAMDLIDGEIYVHRSQFNGDDFYTYFRWDKSKSDASSWMNLSKQLFSQGPGNYQSVTRALILHDPEQREWFEACEAQRRFISYSSYLGMKEMEIVSRLKATGGPVKLEELKKGDLVRYIDKNTSQKGIVKEIIPGNTDEVFVVFQWAKEWEDYEKYTGQLTPVSKLIKNWI
jgi:hypothetical protein